MAAELVLRVDGCACIRHDHLVKLQPLGQGHIQQDDTALRQGALAVHELDVLVSQKPCKLFEALFIRGNHSGKLLAGCGVAHSALEHRLPCHIIRISLDCRGCPVALDAVGLEAVLGIHKARKQLCDLRC